MALHTESQPSSGCRNDAATLPVTSIDDIRSRCKDILDRPEFSSIAWAGVFGSFSAGTQTDSSDVDLLAGYREEATGDDIYYTGDISEALSEELGRDVDCLYLQHKQKFGFIRCLAILHAKTVYGDEEWITEHRDKARRLLAACDKKMRVALRQERLLQAQKTDLIQNDFMEAQQLPPEVADGMKLLIDTIYSGDEDEIVMDQYFLAVLRWTLPIKHIVLEGAQDRFRQTTPEDRLQLWLALTGEMQDASNSLAYIYIPVLDKALKMAKLK